MPKNKRSRENEDEFDMTNIDQDVDMLDVDFQFYEPFETDFHGVKPFLQKAFEFCRKDSIVDLTELTDVACNQGNIGTVCKTGENEEDATVVAILTALNLSQYKMSFEYTIPHLLKFLRKHIDAAELASKCKGLTIDQIVMEKNTGYLMNERLINLPGDIVPPLHKQLVEGIDWSQTAPECPKEERPFYFFDYYLGLAKAQRDKEGLIYLNWEEEIYVDASCYTKEVGVEGTRDNEVRIIYLLEASKLKSVVEQVK